MNPLRKISDRALWVSVFVLNIIIIVLLITNLWGVLR